ncbi:Spo0E family sporulation regulatory protein-aspartic acid phosphatase [Paenibacillus sp. NPDC056579]|uniref:Spo0E family sporulation regulatory protein-aspartic acid phosphatase n=1 Tax=Paenibacillus sp. NPDC056579 TaxID=3345871 RepID=UPI003681B6F1
MEVKVDELPVNYYILIGGYLQLDKVSEIERLIEVKRSELNLAGRNYTLTSDVVLNLSQELDELLNIYYKIKRGGSFTPHMT